MVTMWAQGVTAPAGLHSLARVRLAALLDSLVTDSIAVLHDRRIPGTSLTIDHIAITSAGLWVIDEKPLLGVLDEMIVSVSTQVEFVREVVGDLPIKGTVCLLADLPAAGYSLVSHGIHVLWPTRLARFLTGQVGRAVDVDETRDLLDEFLEAA